MKVGIIGAGAVGSACVTALVSRACARDIVVVNRDRKKARGLVTDVQYGAVLSPAVELRDGDYADLQGASLVMITAGANERPVAPPTAMIRPAGCGCSTPMSMCTRISSLGFMLRRRKR